jgi:hypothetical protein
MYKILIKQKRFLTRTIKVIEAKLKLKIATGIKLWITRTTTNKETCMTVI